jgi:hypothetical protein
VMRVPLPSARGHSSPVAPNSVAQSTVCSKLSYTQTLLISQTIRSSTKTACSIWPLASEVFVSSFEFASTYGLRRLLTGAEVIGSGVLTAQQNRRIRERYGIKGTYPQDLIEGIFCPCCSLNRNEHELLYREGEKAKQQGPRASVAFGDNTDNAYSLEPRMTASGPRGEGSDRGISMSFVRLPQTPRITIPDQSNEFSDRAVQVLTPISESDSLEDAEPQQMGIHGADHAVDETQRQQKRCLEGCPESTDKLDRDRIRSESSTSKQAPPGVDVPGNNVRSCNLSPEQLVVIPTPTTPVYHDFNAGNEISASEPLVMLSSGYPDIEVHIHNADGQDEIPGRMPLQYSPAQQPGRRP